MWINNKLVALPNTAVVHFHPGDDGEIGNGLSAISTGGDQHVDQFFTLVPGGLSPITFSRYAWLALKVAPDPAAPSAQLTVLADYQAMQVRQFDSSGNQTSFAWSQNWAWIICDFLIRKFVLREGKINQPLVAAEVARFDWASFSAAATYYDAVLSGGQRRFSDGGVVYVNDTYTADRALEQMLLMCRSYLLERNGKLSLYADQPRTSVFTFTSDNVAKLSTVAVPSGSVATSSGGQETFKGAKTNLRAAPNRLLPTYRDLTIASGSVDDSTRFAISSSPIIDHEAHQRNVGARGPGLSLIPKVTELSLDLGVNTPERVWRILKSMALRQLGPDVDANIWFPLYLFTGTWTGFEDSLAVEPGDVVTLDKSLGEEFGGKVIEVLQVVEVPDGTRNFTGLEYMPNAFPDVAPAPQTLQAPTPGTGLPPIATGVDANGNQQIGVSTALNLQGNIPSAGIPVGFLSISGKAGPGCAVVLVTWAAQSLVRPDGSSFPLTSSTSQGPARPAAATASQVSGGALGARSYSVRVGLVKNGILWAISDGIAGGSIAISANNLLKVTSPSADANADGWIPLVGVNSAGVEVMQNTLGGGSIGAITPLAFGTNWTEPTAGANTATDSTHNAWAFDPAPTTVGPRWWNLALSATYVLYATMRISSGVVTFPGGILTATNAADAALQSSDGFVALTNGSLSFATPAASSSGSGTGGGSGGGRFGL